MVNTTPHGNLLLSEQHRCHLLNQLGAHTKQNPREFQFYPSVLPVTNT